MSVSWFCRAALLFFVVSTAASAQDASGRFEVYCDGIGFFLTRVVGAPPTRKMLLFLRTDFPGIPYVPKNEWKSVYVYRDGCVPDGKCEVLTNGKVRLDNEFTPDSRHATGQYEIELAGQYIHGQFAAGWRQRRYKSPVRICE